MSRGTQVLAGLVLLSFSAVLVLLAMMPAEDADPGGANPIRWGIALLSGVLGLASLIPWGRPHTTRLALGLLSLTMCAMIVGILQSKDVSKRGLMFAAIVAVVSGSYAITGYYPDAMPAAEVFGRGRRGK